MKLLRVIAFVCALGASTCSGILVLTHFSGATIPGCGVHGDCRDLTSGVWGELAHVPVAFLGLAWFLGFAFVLLPEGSWHLSKSVFWFAFIGLAASIFFSALMLTERKLCPWCVGTHILNVVMIASLWKCCQLPTDVDGHMKPIGFGWLKTFFSAWGITLLLLVPMNVWNQHRIQTRETAAIDETLRESDGRRAFLPQAPCAPPG